MARIPVITPTYMRSINRILKNGFNNEQNHRMGMEDTYGRTRRVPKIDAHFGRNRRNDSKRTFPRINRPNKYRGANCAVFDDVDGGEDGDYGEEPASSEYLWGAFEKSD